MTRTPSQLEPLGIRREQVAELLGISVRKLQDLVAEGCVPGPHFVHGAVKLWSYPVLKAWAAEGFPIEHESSAETASRVMRRLRA